eukprot:8969664-Prorocentrum_lima.AAC.1
MFSVSVLADPDSPERLAVAGLRDLLACPVTRVPFLLPPEVGLQTSSFAQGPQPQARVELEDDAG